MFGSKGRTVKGLSRRAREPASPLGSSSEMVRCRAGGRVLWARKDDEYAPVVLEFIASFEAPTEGFHAKLPSAGVRPVLDRSPTAHGPMNG